MIKVPFGLKPFPRSFFERHTVTVAKALLGNVIVFKNEHMQTQHQLIISETEAYIGKGDPASHAYRGPTPRTEVMFDQPGYAYVYFIYGMYHCLNVVTEPKGTAGAVLIRGAIDLENKHWINGPGRLCKYLGIELTHNRCDLIRNKMFALKKSLSNPVTIDVSEGKRIGISRAKDLKYRFFYEPKEIKAFLT